MRFSPRRHGDTERKGRGGRLAALAAGLLCLAGLAAWGQQGEAPAGRQPEMPRAAAPAPASSASAYKQAVPPYQFQFPRDHAAHPEFQTEWWYYTGHLYSGQRKFGYELTFFQIGIDPKRKQSRSEWALHTLYFAHFTVTDENRNRFQFTETLSRPALEMAGADTSRYHVWIHDWFAKLGPDNLTHELQAKADSYSINLSLKPLKPPVIHGFNGVSQKASGKGRASHYYSITRFETTGTLRLGGETLPVTGLSWMDREYGSNQLTADQLGWDWFSIQLDNNRELMLYILRLKDGSVEPMSSGTVVNADGTWKHLKLADFRIRSTAQWKSPRSNASYPARWTVTVPSENLELEVTPTVADQELVTEATGVSYWEGSCRVRGRDQGRPVTGVAYVELTGYTGSAPGI